MVCVRTREGESLEQGQLRRRLASWTSTLEGYERETNCEEEISIIETRLRRRSSGRAERIFGDRRRTCDEYRTNRCADAPHGDRANRLRLHPAMSGSSGRRHEVVGFDCNLARSVALSA